MLDLLVENLNNLSQPINEEFQYYNLSHDGQETGHFTEIKIKDSLPLENKEAD